MAGSKEEATGAGSVLSGFNPGPLLLFICGICGICDPPSFGATATTVDDQAIPGELISIDAVPTATLRVGGKLRQIPCADLLSIELRSGNPTPRAEDTAIVLRDGGVLRGAIRGGSGRGVSLASPLFGSVECPLRAVARIELPAPQPSPPLQPAEKLDRLLFRNGETVDGTVESVGAEGKGIRFRAEALGQLDIPFERLVAIAFTGGAAASDSLREAQGPGVVAIAYADNGSVVAGRIGSLADGKLALRPAWVPLANEGPGALALDVARVLRIEFRGGRLVYLSDLAPAEAKETPFFDLVWHYRRDLSVDGHPLRLGTRTYRKGLGVHSRCELTYALDGSFRRFLTDVGIDEEVGEKGDVDVAVLVDGQVRFERKGVTGRDDPIPVAVDVAGAKRLTLRVDFGRDFDICDHADWANPHLLR